MSNLKQPNTLGAIIAGLCFILEPVFDSDPTTEMSYLQVCTALGFVLMGGYSTSMKWFGNKKG